MNPPRTTNKHQAARASARSDQGAQRRDDRLKAALKANLARRKAQARARADAGLPDAETHDSLPQGAPDHD